MYEGAASVIPSELSPSRSPLGRAQAERRRVQFARSGARTPLPLVALLHPERHRLLMSRSRFVMRSRRLLVTRSAFFVVGLSHHSKPRTKRGSVSSWPLRVHTRTSSSTAMNARQPSNFGSSTHSPRRGSGARDAASIGANGIPIDGMLPRPRPVPLSRNNAPEEAVARIRSAVATPRDVEGTRRWRARCWGAERRNRIRATASERATWRARGRP